MPLDIPTLALLCASLFVVAVLYSSVGLGGASGYLAVMALFGIFAHEQMTSTALVLNLLVGGTAWWAFGRAGHFSWKLLWPFLAASLPAAFLGGWMRVPLHTYALLLAAVLLFAAWRLIFPSSRRAGEEIEKTPRLAAALPLGAGIGLLSGIVGVGGGIFLSPLLLLFGWAGPKRTAAVTAAFIWVNSLAAIIGRIAGSHFEISGLAPLAGAAFLGGLVGAHLGARRLSGIFLRRLLGVVLFAAAVKLAQITFFLS
jgi:hypothetical protein